MNDKPARRVLGPYQVVRFVARGGMGSVYEGIDPSLKRRVALKVVREGEVPPQQIERFHREAEILAKLRHPNIVTIHDLGSVPDADGLMEHFIAMEFLTGSTLNEAREEMGLAERVKVMEMVARAAGFAHQAGVIHRDLKPGNVIVDRASSVDESGMPWRVVLTDFGLARSSESTDLTRTGALLGTPYYMAPEQVEGDARGVTPRTDVWALGAMLYEMLCDALPFRGKTGPEVYAKISGAEPIAPRLLKKSTPRELENICLKALEKDPARRYADGTQFAADLRRWLDGKPVTALPVPMWKRSIRRLGAIPLIATILLVALGTTIFILATRKGTSDDKLAVETESRQRAEALQRLGPLWGTIVERKRDLRLLAAPPEKAREDLRAAVRSVDEFIRKYPREPQAFYIRARGLLYLNDLGGAESALSEALKIAPDFRPGWTLMGILHLERFTNGIVGRLNQDFQERLKKVAPLLERAQASFAKGPAKGKEREEAERWGLGWLREDEILNVVAEAIRLAGIKSDYVAARALLMKGLEEYRAEEYATWMGTWATTAKEGVEWQTKAIAWAPGFWPPYLARGVAHFNQGNYEAAVEDASMLVKLMPEVGSGYQNRAPALHALGRVAEAKADLEQVLKISGYTAAVRAEVAEIQFLIGYFAEAEEQATRALDDSEAPIAAYGTRGRARARLRKLEGALADLNRAIELEDSSAENRSVRADVRFTMKDSAGGLEDIDRAIELDPTVPEYYIRRGSALGMKVDLAGALRNYEKAIELSGKTPTLLILRGTTFAEMGKIAEALANFEEADRLDEGTLPSTMRQYLNLRLAELRRQ